MGKKEGEGKKVLTGNNRSTGSRRDDGRNDSLDGDDGAVLKVSCVCHNLVSEWY